MRFAKYFLALWLAVIFCAGSVHVADATVATTNTINTYTANGTQTVFPFTYQVLTDANGYPQTGTIAVYLNSILQNSGYTVSANANQTTSPGGSVTFLTAPAAATSVSIQRATPLLQTYAPAMESKLSVPALTTVLDKLIMISQETGYQASLKLGIPANASLGSVLVVNPVGSVDVVAPIHAGYVLTDNGPGQKPSFQASTSGSGGNVSGPGTSTDYAIPLWNGTAGTNLRGGVASSTHTGYVLTDNGSGIAPSFQAPSGVSGPGTTTNYGLALWNGTTGIVLRDGGSLGSVGQKLTSNGAGVAPTFQTDKTNVFGISRVPFRRAMWWQSTSDAATAITAIGGQVLTPSGTVTSQRITNLGKYVRYQTAASTNSVAGVISPSIDETEIDFGPIVSFDIYTDAAVTSQRNWIGLFDNSPASTDVLTAKSGFGFRQSSAAGDTTWKCVTANAGTITVVDSGVTVSPNTSYRLLIDASTSGKVEFWINEAKVATITTNLPAANVGLGPAVLMTTLANTAQQTSVSIIYLDTQ